MKVRNAKYFFFLSGILAVCLSSCLKDDEYNNHDIQSNRPDGAQNAIYVGLTATSNDNHLQLAFENSNADTTFDAVPIQIAGGNAKEDIEVTVAYNPALLGNYNSINGTTHEESPTDLYTVLNPGDSTGGYIVTIPKGSDVGYFQLKLNPSKFLGFDYALGLQIVNVPSGYVISTNYNTGILAIGVKNDYDGIYSYKGYSLRAGDAALTGYFSGKEMPLVTKGATSVGFETLALWGDGNSQISIGNPILTLNTSAPAPYPVTISSSGGGYNDPDYDSRYDPATKTFYISYSWGAGPSSRLSTDTLPYLRPR